MPDCASVLERRAVEETRGRVGLTAVIGATLIDGNGGEPVPDAAVVVDGERIVATGTRASVHVPTDAVVIDAAGGFLLPGFIDTNVHLAPFYYPDELVAYRGRYADVAIESAQLMLRAGVTTVRDTYGHLPTLLQTRDAFASGDVAGPRVLVAGNIVGWGGPRSLTFDHNPYLMDNPVDPRTTFLLETIQDEFVQGVGEELCDLGPAELRATISAYLERGVDLLKFGGTTHVTSPPMILFSPRAQEAMVEEAHAAGLVVDVHATSPEALRIAVDAGVDVVQHPELHFISSPMPDDLAELLATSGVTCSMNVPHFTGRVWSEYLAQQEQLERADVLPNRSLTGVERRKRDRRLYRRLYRSNADKIVAAGCQISTASDSCALPPRGVLRGTETYLERFFHQPGTGTLSSIEGLVELGLGPMNAIVAATKHGALASDQLEQYGTVEAGKSADLVLLGGDPLEDIANVRSARLVISRGLVVDRAALPTNPVYSEARCP
jgi:imidazolonepropionase-like amidohydrolase